MEWMEGLAALFPFFFFFAIVMVLLAMLFARELFHRPDDRR